jgi:uncharacterized membrane protein YgcG
LRARPVLLILALLSALALTAPATAPAADADVEAAWKSEDAALAAGGKKVSRAVRAAQRSKFRRVGSAVSAIKALETLTIAVRDRVVAQSSSTRSGALARERALAALKGFAASLKSLRQAVQAAGTRKGLRKARLLLERSKLQADGASDDAADARGWFQAAKVEAEAIRREQEQQQQQQQQNPPPDGGSGGGGGSEPPPDGGGGSGGGGSQPPPPPPDPCSRPVAERPPECFLRPPVVAAR